MSDTQHLSDGTTPVFQILADDIKAMGVECVFGLMSDDTRPSCPLGTRVTG